MPIGRPIDRAPDSPSDSRSGSFRLRTRRGRTELPTVLLLLLGAAGLVGCGDELSGPAPRIATAAPALDPQPADPPVVCGRQLTTEVVVHGQGFSPLPLGLPDDARTRLPELELLRTHQLDGAPLDPAAFDRARFAGDADGPNAAHLSWQSATQMTLVVDQQLTLALGTAESTVEPGALPPGGYDLLVTNPGGDSASSPGALAVVDQPHAAGPAPGLVCLAEEARTITLSGESFLELDGAAPTVDCGGLELPLDALGDCTPLAHAGVQGQLCRSGQITLGQAALDAGYPALTVRNPAPAACVSEETTNLRVVGPPRLDGVLPPLVCTAQGARELVLRGDGLLQIDGVLPQATVTDPAGTAQPVEVLGAGPGCSPLETMGHEVQTCSELTVRLPVLDPIDPYAPTLALTNPAPAGCSAQASGAQGVLVVPPPTLAALDPPLLCAGAGPGLVTLHGRNLIMADGEAPIVTVAGTTLEATAVTPQNCVALPVQGLLASVCSELELRIDPALLSDGQGQVTVTNPAPAGCSATLEQPLVLVPPPVVETVTPALACTDTGARTLQLTGSGLLAIGEALPQVVADGQALTTIAIADCAEHTVGEFSWRECRSLTVEAAQGSLAPGTPELVVSNPLPLGCAGAVSGLLVVPPHLALSAAEPSGLCSLGSGERSVVLRGDGLLVAAGTLPTVTLDGQVVPASAPTGCTPLPVPGLAAGTVQSCTGLTLTVAADLLDGGAVTVALDQPLDEACGAEVEGLLDVVPAPVLTDIAPAEVCSEQPEPVVLHGEDFAPTAQVSIGGRPAAALTVVDASRIEALPPAGLDPGVYDVTVSNGPGCEATLPEALHVHPQPVVFFVDPPVTYSGLRLQATIFVSGLDAEAAEVRLIGPGGTILEPEVSYRDGRHNRLLVTLPAGMTAGAWDVEVVSRVGCDGRLPAGLLVTDDLRVAIASVEPAFASTDRSTAVTILGPATLPEGSTGFVSPPRAYLSPSEAGAGGGAAEALATGLRAVLFVDERTLTAVVPAGLVPGPYDLVIVNPDGGVGLLPRGVTVTADQPPVVTAVEPASFDGNGPVRARLLGDYFGAADGGVQVALTCRHPTSGELSEAPAVVDEATLTEQSVSAVFPANLFAGGSVCIVRLTRGDGAYFNYSAVSIKTPAQNLAPWQQAPPLVEARRAPVLVAGRPTPSSRYLYAIGGDAGSPASASQTAEAAGVDIFGDMGAWSLQRNSLPAPRTGAGIARAGRFLYLVGGHDGGGPVATVLRAEVLDPLATPEILDLDLTLDGKEGDLAGLLHYRVSALFPADDPSNPGGESLPGEVLVVQLPEREGLQLTLFWNRIPGASGYRVWRSPQAGAGAAELELLATVQGGDSLSYADDGGPTTPGVTPLPPGSTGVWHELVDSPLGTPREGLASLAVAVPGQADQFELYAFGGRGPDGAALDTYEHARITLAADGSQLVSAFTPGRDRLASGRADLGAFLVTNADSAAVPSGEAWIFIGPGRGTGGTLVNDVEASFVGSDGDLDALIATDAVSGGMAGYGYGAANGFLFLFGGRGGEPTDSGISGELCPSAASPGCAQAPDEPADLRNWNNLGVRLTGTRISMGSAQESAFFFVAGGFDGTAVTHAVDQTVQ